LEPTYQLYVEHIVTVFDELRRVLRGDGTLWLNLGDCYATGAGKVGAQVRDSKAITANLPNFQPNRMPQSGLKPKDLVGIPWRVAFALQDAGWWLRQDIVWAKPNPMPESVTDRCTTAHEYLFHFSKSARYFYDSEATKEPAANTGGGTRAAPDKAARAGIVMNKGLATNGTGATTLRAKGAATRNKRSVWAVASAPYAGAHFATFPPALIEPCILAGTSERGVCPKCGAPWVRVVDRASRDDCRYTDTGFPGEGKDRGRRIASGGVGIGASAQTIGWRAACSCDAGAVPAVVLDPFLGAGTTARVADRFARDCIGIELLPKYAAMADRRTREPGLALA
jgi:DNA modification methylase